MNSCIDYFKQIARGDVVTKDVLEKRYNEFLNFINKLKSSDMDRTIELIKLRFDFLVTSKLLENHNSGLSYESLKKEYDKIVLLAQSRKLEFNDKAKIRNESTNPYRNLSVPQNADIVRINNSYLAQIENLEKYLEREENKLYKDLDNIIELYAYFLLYSDARDILLDKDKRRTIDEDISLGFNPNKEDLYTEDIYISGLKFIPNKKNRVSYEMRNKYGDLVIFENTGRLEYGQFGRKNPLFKDKGTLQKYKIRKIYNDNSSLSEREFEVYTFLNINQMSLDEEFTSMHSNILFSDVNLEQAIIHNGGYIGEVKYDDNGKIVIEHEADKLCACKEYEKMGN